MAIKTTIRFPQPPPGENWYRIYLQDRRAMLDTMQRNLLSDLDAGYSPQGQSVTTQRKRIDDFKKEFASAIDMLRTISANEREYWCYCELLTLGAID